MLIKKQYPELLEAMSNLLCVCDGASSVDTMGFAKFDVPFARSLYSNKDWTSRQALAVHKMLKKYTKQLLNYGIKYIELPVPEISPDDNKSILKAISAGDRIELSVTSPNSNLFHSLINEIKDMPSRKYNPDKKVWSIPFNVKTIDKIRKMNFELDSKILEWYKVNTSQETIEKQEKKFNPESLCADIDMDMMYPFQKEGLAFIEKMNGRALIGDEMGLGKTIQALAWLKLHPEARPAVVICPATLKINWQREAQKWIKEKSFIINGRNNVDKYKNEKLIIINYDIVKDHVESLKALKPMCIIGDEIHKVKNNKAQRTKAVKQLCKNVPNVIFLSGTAILNRPIEIFNAINILQPEVFNNYYRFGQRYCEPKFNGFGTSYDGASNIEELHNLLTEYVMIRRKKVDVLKDLPEKRKQLISFDITNREEYKKAEDDIIQFIWDQNGMEAAQRASRAEVLARFNKLKQLSSQGKMDSVIEWIEDFLEESNEKLVVFAIHTKIVDMLMEKFKGIAVKIDGSCSQKARQDAVDQFQGNTAVRLFVGNIQAASEGITLTAASNTVFIELAWSPSLHEQAESRTHRIGQTNSCMAYYLLAQNTIEEDIAEMIDRKQRIVDAVLDGTSTPEDSLLTELWNKYKEKGK